MSTNRDLPTLLSRVEELECRKKALDAQRREQEIARDLAATKTACEERVQRLEKELEDLEAKVIKTRTIRAEEPKYWGPARGEFQLPEADWDNETLELLQAVLVNGPWTNELRQKFIDKLAKLARLERRLVVRAAFAMGFVMRSKTELTFAKASIADLVEAVKEVSDVDLRLQFAKNAAKQVHSLLSSVEFDVWGAKPEAEPDDHGIFNMDSEDAAPVRDMLPWQGPGRHESKRGSNVIQVMPYDSHPRVAYDDGDEDPADGLHLGTS